MGEINLEICITAAFPAHACSTCFPAFSLLVIDTSLGISSIQPKWLHLYNDNV